MTTLSLTYMYYTVHISIVMGDVISMWYLNMYCWLVIVIRVSIVSILIRFDSTSYRIRRSVENQVIFWYVIRYQCWYKLLVYDELSFPSEWPRGIVITVSNNPRYVWYIYIHWCIHIYSVVPSYYMYMMSCIYIYYICMVVSL